MFPKLLGECLHCYSLHASYFLVMCSAKPEARIPLWHPGRMGWRQWFSSSLCFQSHKTCWAAFPRPALSAGRDSEPTCGSKHTGIGNQFPKSSAHQKCRGRLASTGITLAAWKGDMFLCIPAYCLLTPMFRSWIHGLAMDQKGVF